MPYGSFPTQAVVRIEDGKLVVRQRGSTLPSGRRPATAASSAVTSYQRKSGVSATKHDPADVSVFDMKGNRLPPKAWKEKFKSDVHVLVAYDGQAAEPAGTDAVQGRTRCSSCCRPRPPRLTVPWRSERAPSVPAYVLRRPRPPGPPRRRPAEPAAGFRPRRPAGCRPAPSLRR